MGPMKIAVVGSGISGIGSAWLLSDKHEVTLFEKDSRLGGHSYTVDITVDNVNFPVDTGFLVHNDQTYPHIIEFFKALGIRTAPSEMTLAIKILKSGMEWGGENLKTVFAQKRNLFSLKFWRMIKDIIRMNKRSKEYLETTKASQASLGQFLADEKFSEEFIHWYLMPMGASIWSTPTKEMLDFPAHTFIQFCINHSLLQIEGRPQWKTVVGGSRTYVEKAAQKIQKIKKGVDITKILRVSGGVEIHSNLGVELFDAVVMATHAPTTAMLVQDLSEKENWILNSFPYQKNTAYLHTDKNLLPGIEEIHSAWNFTSTEESYSEAGVSVSYLINKLQPLPVSTPIIVTLNPVEAPAQNKILKVIEYEHPVFDNRSIQAQQALAEVQGLGGLYYAGAWTRYGFHEDGLLSAVNVARLFGVNPPWHT